MQEKVILVDANDTPIGEMEKMEAHRSGVLHRAFSVFVFNSKGELLLQKRAIGKYHSGGKWTNTCCSHPRPGESTPDAASRRLNEEMNMACPLDYVFGFTYKAEFENGLIEHEFDHVYFGTSDLEPLPDPEEVSDWKYENMDKLAQEIIGQPDQFTPWFRICFKEVHRFQARNILR